MKINFFLFLLCFILNANAQESRRKFLGIETGMTLIASEITKIDYIRREAPSYTYYDNNSLTSQSYKSFIGVKPELFSLSNKFGFLGGVRFSHFYSSIVKNNSDSKSASFFYFFSGQDGVNTEYLRVNRITQTSYYIGIPLEIRYFLNKHPLFQLYIKLGTELSYRLQSKTDVLFNNDEMETYQNEVTSVFGQPKSFNSTIYGAGGVNFSSLLKIPISFEVCLPTLFFTTESTGLVNPFFGCGFQLNIQVPLKSKVQ